MKIIVITGASRGIGRATAQKFLDEGWRVIGTSTSGDSNFDNENFKLVTLDYLRPETISTSAEEIKKMTDVIDVLLNNAGVVFDLPDVAIDIAKLRKTLEVDLIGQIDLTERLIPLIKDGGHIINVGSRSAVLNEPLDDIDAPAYRIAKTALSMYTKLIAQRPLNKKIIASSIDPGWVKTDMGNAGATEELKPNREPEDVVNDIYNLIMSNPETGYFWKFRTGRRGEKRSW